MLNFAQLAKLAATAGVLIAAQSASAAYTFQNGSMSLTLTSDAIAVANLAGWSLGLPAGSTSSVDFATAAIKQSLTDATVLPPPSNLASLKADGSGFSVTRGTYTVSFSNFDVRTNAGQVFADIVAGGVSYGHKELFNYSLASGSAASIISQAGTYDYLGLALVFNRPTVEPWIYNLIPAEAGPVDFNTPVANLKATITFAAVVPEPSTYVLMAAGLVAAGAVARRRRMVV